MYLLIIRKNHFFVQRPLQTQGTLWLTRNSAISLNASAYSITALVSQAAIGQFRTPWDLVIIAGLFFGVSGDWQQAPPCTSLKNVPERVLDFFIKPGDSIKAEYDAHNGLLLYKNH